MLDFRMETFLTVCRCMNFTRASEELQITQPAVSQHIRYLEKYYGKKLFYYEGKRLGLTEAGEMLKNASLMMVQDEQSLQDRMQGSEKQRQELRFGVVPSIGDSLVTEVLKQFLAQNAVPMDKKRRRTAGRTYLKLVTGQTEMLLKEMDAGKIDFALIDGLFRKQDYESQHYTTERLLAVCGSTYEFPKEPRTFKELLSGRVLLPEEGDGARAALERYLGMKELCTEDFAETAEISSPYMLKELTKEGLGITFLYGTAVQKELESGELREIELKDFRVTHNLTFVWRKGSSRAAQYRGLFGRFTQLS